MSLESNRLAPVLPDCSVCGVLDAAAADPAAALLGSPLAVLAAVAESLETGGARLDLPVLRDLANPRDAPMPEAASRSLRWRRRREWSACCGWWSDPAIDCAAGSLRLPCALEPLPSSGNRGWVRCANDVD